jgi:fructoselysine-6-P-deglycase FrlB-like protein
MTGLWDDLGSVPDTLRATIEHRAERRQVRALLGSGRVGRLVVSANGASLYVGLALQIAALWGRSGPAPVCVLPAGVLSHPGFQFRPDDAVLTISASGEMAELVLASRRADFPRPFIVVTSSLDSTLAGLADVVVPVDVVPQRAVTHTFAYTNAVAACLSIWADAQQDESLMTAIGQAPDVFSRHVRDAESWRPEFPSLSQHSAAMCLGTGAAWPAAMEAALLVKEVGRIPCEGSEASEGVTSTMTGLPPGSLALLISDGDRARHRRFARMCVQMGFAALDLPFDHSVDPRLTSLTSFPHAVRLSILLANSLSRDVDRPDWTDDYFRVARLTRHSDHPDPQETPW